MKVTIAFAYEKTLAADKTGIPFKNLYSYMIKMWKEIRNVKNLAIKLQKVMKKKKKIKWIKKS